MGCEEIRELLSEYVDGTLDEKTSLRLREHLSACEACQKELASLKALVNELRSLEPVEAPRDFVESLHERVEPRFTMAKVLKLLFVPAGLKIPLEVATVAVLLVALFIGFGRYRPEEKVVSLPQAPRQEQVAKKAIPDQEIRVPKEVAPKPVAPPQVIPGREPLREMDAVEPAPQAGAQGAFDVSRPAESAESSGGGEKPAGPCPAASRCAGACGIEFPGGHPF